MKIQNNGTDVEIQPIINFTNPTSITVDRTNARLDVVLPGGGGGGVSDGDKGDIVVSGTGTVWTIDTAAVTLAKMANMATASFIGRNTASTGAPEVLSAATATAILSALVGDSGSGGTKGLVPAPSAGDAAAGKFLKASGAWVAVTAPTVGTATIDFGAFPGASDASITVTGQTGISTGSVVQAWLRPEATSDHTADEHMLETIKVVAGNIVAGTGFTIYAINTNQINEPLQSPKIKTGATVSINIPDPSVGGIGTRIYGQWTVAWCWQ